MTAPQVHNVLEAACKILGVDPRPYDDGSKPVLHNPTYIALALWLANEVAPKLPAAAGRSFAPRIALARRVIAGETIDRDTLNDLRRIAFAKEEPPDDAARVVQSLALETCEGYVRNPCGKGSRAIAAVAARLHGKAILDRLAAEILRLDAVTTVERQKLGVSRPILRTAWRGHSGAKLTHVIVELEGGAFGLIAKTRGRWTWSEGARDDVLATVPDAQMEAAVAAVIGATPPARPAQSTKASSAKSGAHPLAMKSEIARLDELLVAVALGPAKSAWFATRDGRVGRWEEGEPRLGGAAVKGIRGLVADDRTAITWGSEVTRWDAGTLMPATIGEEAVGALLVDGGVVWWTVDTIVLGRKRVAGLEGQRLLAGAAGEILVLANGRLRRLATNGKVLAEKELPGGSEHAVSPDAAHVAVWSRGAKPRTVTVLPVGGPEKVRAAVTLTTDSGHIDEVVFARDLVLVRYHEAKRVAVFDLASGQRRARLQARELGSRGSAVDSLHPLRCGAVLAFAPYPRGEAILVDAQAQPLGHWRLERFYVNGKSFVAEAPGHVLFGHSRDRDGTRLLRFASP